MKKIIFIFSSFAALNLWAATDLKLNCDIVSINSPEVFEESANVAGLELEDYNTTVSLETYKDSTAYLSIGDWAFSSGDKGVSMSMTDTVKDLTVRVDDRNVQSLIVKYYKASQKGVVLYKSYKEKDFAKFTEAVTFDCKDYSKEMELMKSGRTAEKKIKLEQIPSIVRDTISIIDVAFEMGDGYYSTKYEKFYELSLQGKVVGYRQDSYLSYTEGDDEIASTYYLTNGVRFSGPLDIEH